MLNEYQKRVFEIAAEMSRLKKRLAQLREEFKHLVPGDPNTVEKQEPEEADESTQTVKVRIMRLLTNESGKEFGVGEIIDALGDANAGSVRVTLQRLTESGVLFRAGRKYRIRTKDDEDD